MAKPSEKPFLPKTIYFYISFAILVLSTPIALHPYVNNPPLFLAALFLPAILTILFSLATLFRPSLLPVLSPIHHPDGLVFIAIFDFIFLHISTLPSPFWFHIPLLIIFLSWGFFFSLALLRPNPFLLPRFYALFFQFIYLSKFKHASFPLSPTDWMMGVSPFLIHFLLIWLYYWWIQSTAPTASVADSSSAAVADATTA